MGIAGLVAGKGVAGKGVVTRTARRVAALGLVVSSLAGVGASQAQESGSDIRQVGTLERIPQDVRDAFGETIVPNRFFEGNSNDVRAATAGTMLVFAEVRQLWQVYPFPVPNGTGVAVRDLDTGRLIKTFRLPGRLIRSGSATGEWMHTVDGARRVFLAYATNGLGVLEVDFRTFATRQRQFEPAPFAEFGGFAGIGLGGVTYDPHGERVLALFGAVAGLNLINTNTFLYGLDVSSTAATGQFSFRQLRSCGGPLPSADGTLFASYGFPVLVNAEHLWIPCHRAGKIGTVIRLPHGAAFDPASEELIAIGPASLKNVLADQASGRLFLMTSTAEMWVFEAATMAFIGVVPANADRSPSPNVSYGIDPVSGRVFFLSSAYGLGVVEGRFFPVPQARTRPQAAAQAMEFIFSDAKTGRIFVLPGVNNSKPTSYTVYSVGMPPTPPSPPDPDRNTVDRKEEIGETEARYFASGSGYGTRVLMANGLATVPPAPVVGPASPIALAVNVLGVSKCGFTDRELVAGRVTKAEYDTGSTAAAAIAVDVDERSKLDIDKPSRCDLRLTPVEAFKGLFGTSPDTTAPIQESIENQNADKPRWGRRPAACSSSEGDKAGSEGRGKDEGLAADVSLGSSLVKCRLPGEPLEARATSRLTGPVAVGHADTSVNIVRDGTGVRSVVESFARDIELDVSEQTKVRIGEVRAVATSWSYGRPTKLPQSTHEFFIKRVRIGSVEVCAENCDPRRVVAQLNQVLAGRVEFRIADGIDDRLRLGSPKGALTAVQKSVQRQTSDRSLIGDFTTEVPALDMVVYNDNSEWGRARQLYQFAGVASAATYNIALLPKEVDFPDDPEVLEDEDSEVAFEEPGDDSLGGVFADSTAEILSEGPTDGKDSGGVMDAIRDAASAVAKGIRLFFTNPRQSLLLLTGWALFSLPGFLARRRLRLLQSL